MFYSYLFYLAFDLSIFTTLSRLFAYLWRRCPKGIDNPFNPSGCEYLLFVCNCRSRSVAWFTYWFDNLGFITEGNTYHRCAASSLPLWGNTDIASRHVKRNFWRRCRGGSSTYTRFLITNLISSELHYLPFASRFPLPYFTKKFVLFALFFVRRFLAGSVLSAFLLRSHNDSREHQVV